MIERLLTILSAALTAGAVSPAARSSSSTSAPTTYRSCSPPVRTEGFISATSEARIRRALSAGRLRAPAVPTTGPDLACPRGGGRNFRNQAARITRRRGYEHRLRYVSHSSRQLASQRHRTVVKMTDCCQSAGCRTGLHGLRPGERHHHAQGDPQPRGGVPSRSQLLFLGKRPLKSDKYLLTHLCGATGAWLLRSITLLTRRSKSIKSMRAGAHHPRRKSRLHAHAGQRIVQPNYGGSSPGALAWAGISPLAFEWTNTTC